MKASLFDYELPEDRIAQAPLKQRDRSKLLLCEHAGRLGDCSGRFHFQDRIFSDLTEILTNQDVLVLNNAKVLPVRLLGKRKDSEGSVEALLLRRLSDREYRALLNLSARVKKGMMLEFEPGLFAEIQTSHEERLASGGEVHLVFSGPMFEELGLVEWLVRYGHIPLPHYIKNENAADKYQTVFASIHGSAAAPTAGFHFTTELLDKLKAKGVQILEVTLHVGIGTFRPIKAEEIEDHAMHEEVYEITAEFAESFLKARAAGKRVVAVGTTVVRALESWAAENNNFKPGVFATSAYIQPGHEFKLVDDLITNFHLPRSTLLVLIAAGVGIENQKAAYSHAIQNNYRFFSYGDAMFIRGAK